MSVAAREVIRAEGLVKVYGAGDSEVRALDGVDLCVGAGEMVLMMGPSGSGKTTLLSVMGCILRPTGGRLAVAGRETAGLSEAELAKIRLGHVGFIFQAYNLFPALSARQNVMVACDLKGFSPREAAGEAQRLLETVGLGQRADFAPAKLSGGQRQRVAIARALAGDPDIILADEPTGALDSRNGRMVMELLRDLAHQGRAVVVVSHDGRVRDYADRVVRMEDGRISGDSREQGEEQS
jgi:putative ABC transport system ATP-binding protein